MFPVCCLLMYILIMVISEHGMRTNLDIYFCITKVDIYLHGQDVHVFSWRELQYK
jgi:hypothetical protein